MTLSNDFRHSMKSFLSQIKTKYGKKTSIWNSISAKYSDSLYETRWPPYWPTGRLADNQKLGNLTDNLIKMSNKTYSKAVIGQFKTLIS